MPSSSRVLCCIDKSWDAPAYTEYSKLDYVMIAIQSERALNHSDQIVDSGGVDFLPVLQALMFESLPTSMLGKDARTLEEKINDVKTVLKGEFTKFTLTPTNPGHDLEFERGAGNAYTIAIADDSLRDGLKEILENLMNDDRYEMHAANGHRQMRHAMSTLMIFILKPSNVTMSTYKTIVKKLNFPMEAYPLNVTDFRKVCNAVLAKCAITHDMWLDLSTDFETNCWG